MIIESKGHIFTKKRHNKHITISDGIGDGAGYGTDKGWGNSLGNGVGGGFAGEHRYQLKKDYFYSGGNANGGYDNTLPKYI